MQSDPHFIKQTRHALGDIRYELWAIEVGHVVPKNKIEAVRLLRGKEKMAAAIVSNYEESSRYFKLTHCLHLQVQQV